MSLSALIQQKGGLGKIATVTAATVATEEGGKGENVAKVASVAVASSTEPKTEQAANPPPQGGKQSRYPLTDSELANLTGQTARDSGLDPLAVWCWLSAEDIEVIRSGDPFKIRAFEACVEFVLQSLIVMNNTASAPNSSKNRCGGN